MRRLLLLLAVAPSTSLVALHTPMASQSRWRSSGPSARRLTRAAEPRMEDLLSTLAPLAAFPVMFVAIQAITEKLSAQMDEAGMLDLEQKTPEQLRDDPFQNKDPPKPISDFIPKVELPDWVPKPELPKLELPKELPTLPTELPKLELPTELPKLPTKMPTFSLPFTGERYTKDFFAPPSGETQGAYYPLDVDEAAGTYPKEESLPRPEARPADKRAPDDEA